MKRLLAAAHAAGLWPVSIITAHARSACGLLEVPHSGAVTSTLPVPSSSLFHLTVPPGDHGGNAMRAAAEYLFCPVCLPDNHD